MKTNNENQTIFTFAIFIFMASSDKHASTSATRPFASVSFLKGTSGTSA